MEELDESELGSQHYWNHRYADEIVNYDNHGDVGEIWFGDDIVCRIIKWLNNKEKVDKTKSILDVGCGNGMLLIELWEEGYSNLSGIDYSNEAILLAKKIAEKECCDISYQVADLLTNGTNVGTFDIVLDKGTYDAISLTADAKSNRNKYIENVHSFLKDDGLLLITSCNWTEHELSEQFADRFVLYECIPTPQFKFGGKVGSVVSSVVFKKKDVTV